MSLINDKVYTQEDEALLSTLLLSVGIMPSKAGFRYLKTSVLNYKKFNGNMSAICTYVAKNNNVSKDSVERDMRTAIENACRRGWFKRFNEIIGVNFLEDGEKLKTKEFIAIVVEYLDDPRSKKSLLKY